MNRRGFPMTFLAQSGVFRSGIHQRRLLYLYSSSDYVRYMPIRGKYHHYHQYQHYRSRQYHHQYHHHNSIGSLVYKRPAPLNRAFVARQIAFGAPSIALTTPPSPCYALQGRLGGVTRSFATNSDLKYQVTCESSRLRPGRKSMTLLGKTTPGESSVSMRAMSSSASSVLSSAGSSAKMNCNSSQSTVVGSSPTMSKAYIALGSNMGDRLSMLEQSLEHMKARGIYVTRTSSLYETAPMYVTDQDPFLNGICEVETRLAPIELLDALQSIENEMGRVKIIDKGPRVIDLDIVLYNDVEYSDERLNIPHKLMLEREFVLRPLCQLIPAEHPPIPDASLSYRHVLDRLPISYPRPVSITPISPSYPNIKASDPSRPTHIMAVLNVTPDSFSDGGLHSSQNLAALAEDVREMIRSGATIIDVGGESTRPSSVPVGAEEEISRVIPAIKLIKSLPEAANVAISIDTYRAVVAEAAVNAGADIINDISAGMMDKEMFPTMARLGKTVILMHMRGTPQTMMKFTKYDNDDVITGVGKELLERVREAEKAGIRRWRIILDPGIGFAKTQKQNLSLLRNGAALKQFEGLSDLPWLVGTSRKNFIGKITGVEKAMDRVWGTAASVTAAVQGGADIIRIHDVKEMTQVAKMADAIYRT